MVTLLNIVSIVGPIAAIGKSKYWPYTYFFGWIFGQMLLVSTGFYSFWEIVLYLLICSGMIYVKIYGKIK